MRMNLQYFRRAYAPLHERLDTLVARKRRGLRTGAQIAEMVQLYLAVTSHLSYARTYYPDSPVTASLNALVAQARLILYSKTGGQWTAIGVFLRTGFPRALRSAWGGFAVAWGVMLAGMLSAFVIVMHAPGSMYALLPSSFLSQFHPHGAAPAHPEVLAPLLSSAIMTNNIKVAIFAFLGAFTLGVFTLYILFQNGLILGALAAAFWQAGRSVQFWSLIVPHGCIELTAIAVAGTAGLLGGYRLLVPGRVSRGQALVQSSRTGGQLLLGTTGLLVIAGTIEGFLTPSGIPAWGKFAFAAATVVFLVAYLGFSGRVRRT